MTASIRDIPKLFIIVDNNNTGTTNFQHSFKFAYDNDLFKDYAPLYLHDTEQLHGTYEPLYTTISGEEGGIPAGFYSWLKRKNGRFVSHEELGVKEK